MLSRAVVRSAVNARWARRMAFSTGEVQQEQADVVVIGGGVMGMNVAYQLGRRAGPDARVTLVEKGANVGEGSTGASSAILRHLYTYDNMMQLARDGINLYKSWGDYTGLGSDVTAGFRETGALWILPSKSQEDYQRDVERLASFGVEAEVLDKQGMLAQFPYLSACSEWFDHVTLQKGAGPTHPPENEEIGEDWHECNDKSVQEFYLYEKGVGYFEPVAALNDLVTACRRDGVNVQFNTQVVDVLVKETGQTPAVDGVVVRGTDGDREIRAPVVVNCSGPWVHNILEQAGVSIKFDLRPTRIQVMYRQLEEKEQELPDGVNLDTFPFLCDTFGHIYMRPQHSSQQLLVSTAREEEEVGQTPIDPDDYENACDPEFRQKYLNSMHHRIPCLGERGTVTGMSGVYTVNQQDVHPLIGETHQQLSGFYLCNGWSGHGFKCGPSVGSLMAQRIAQDLDSSAFSTGALDDDTPVDIEFFSPYREPLHLDDKTVMA